MRVTEALKMAVQQVLVDKAINFEMDGDMNELDINDVFAKAEDMIKNNSLYSRGHRREVLYSEILSGGTENNNALSALDSANDSDMAINVVDVVELYENFTVKEIKDLLTQ